MALEFDKSQLDDMDWRNDWSQFVDALALVYSQVFAEHSQTGIHGGDELMKIFGDSEVCWIGELENVDIHEELAPGVAFAMPVREVTLANGHTLKARRVTLTVEPDEASWWESCSVGDTIKFRASIIAPSPSRPPLRFSAPATPKTPVTLMMRLRTGAPLEKGKPGEAVAMPAEQPTPAPAMPAPVVVPTDKYPTDDPAGPFKKLGQLENRLISENKMPDECWGELDVICQEIKAQCKPDDMVTRLLTFLERVPDDIDIGTPGTVVHTIESTHPAYLDALKDSITRQPTGYSMWLADRATRENEKLFDTWRPIFESVRSNSNATQAAKETAKMVLESE